MKQKFGESTPLSSLPLKEGGTERVSLLGFCRYNRRNKTPAEQKMWNALRARKLGVHFRQQHQIGQYIVDFVCLKKKLVVECDGGQHTSKRADSARTHFLESKGFVVLRFWNNEILSNLEGCVMKIKEVLDCIYPLQTSPSKGEAG